MGEQITMRSRQEWNNRQMHICGAEHMEKVSSSTWKVSDCSAKGRAGGLTCPRQVEGSSLVAKAPIPQSGCLFRVSWMRGEGRGPYTCLLQHSKGKSQQGEGACPNFPA